MRIFFIAFAWLFTLFVGLQVLLAGAALFVDPASWMVHASFARYVALLPLLMLILAWSGRLPARWLWRSAGLLGMVIGLFLTAILSSRIGVLSALHPVIALLLFSGSAELLRSFRH